MVQIDVHAAECIEAAREHAVEEHHEGVVDDRPGVAQGLTELDLAGAVGGEVLDQQGPPAVRHVPLDQCIPAKAFRLLAHVGHRGQHAIGDPGGERDAGGFPAGDHVDAFVADVAADLFHREFADFGASAREKDDPPAVDIDGRLPARRQRVGFLGPEIDRLDLQQDARCGKRCVPIPIRRMTPGHVQFCHHASPAEASP